MANALKSILIALALSSPAAAHPDVRPHAHVDFWTCALGQAVGAGECQALDASKRERDNKMARDIANHLGLTKDQLRQLHDAISGMDYDFHEVMEIARQIANK